jgi:hypothetical protein
MTPQEQQTLELIATADLYEEFKRRFDHCVVAGLNRRPTEEDADHYLMSFTYSGAPIFCLGLAGVLTNRCQHDIERMLNPSDPNEL